ncbi:MAG: hypothetical protein KAJ18_11615 [Candidatus Omnitrophica bacterium]|nr:hypothetical protein [Candidatus Omnitrophota bacterium]
MNNDLSIPNLTEEFIMGKLGGVTCEDLNICKNAGKFNICALGDSVEQNKCEHMWPNCGYIEENESECGYDEGCGECRPFLCSILSAI